MFKYMPHRSHKKDYSIRQVGHTDRACRMDKEKLCTADRPRGVRQLCPPLPHRSNRDGAVGTGQRTVAQDTGDKRDTMHRLRSMRESVSGTTVPCHICRRTRSAQNHLRFACNNSLSDNTGNMNHKKLRIMSDNENNISRRKFLKLFGIGTAAAAATLTGCKSQNQMNSQTTTTPIKPNRQKTE